MLTVLCDTVSHETPLGDIGEDGASMNRRKWSLTLLAAFFLVVPPFLSYVLYYAPVVRFTTVQVGTPVYAPVDWLTDNTQLRDPLLDWAELWGVREEFEWGALLRNPALQEAMRNPPDDVDLSYPGPEEWRRITDAQSVTQEPTQN